MPSMVSYETHSVASFLEPHNSGLHKADKAGAEKCSAPHFLGDTSFGLPFFRVML